GLRGLYAGGAPQLTRALDLQRRVLGPEHPETLTTQNNVAGLFLDQGKYAEAEPLYRQALEAQGRVLGPEHADTLITQGNLARLFHPPANLPAPAPPSHQT